MARADEVSATSDKTIRIRLKKPFPLLTYALAQVYCAIMPERLAQTDANEQIKEAVGSGPFKFLAAERGPGQRGAFETNPGYVPRKGANPSFNPGPKSIMCDRA